MLDQNSAVPLYEQLKGAISADIISGVYKPGTRLPSEAELEAEYGVSRITVRRAVKELVAEGFIVKKQGKGTFVRSVRSLSVCHETEVVILEKRIAHACPDFTGPGIDADDDVIYLRYLLRSGSSTRMISSVYLPLKLYPELSLESYSDSVLLGILQKEYGRFCQSGESR